jgi:ribosome biogenesis protein BRX1
MVDKLTSKKNQTEKQLVEIGPRFVLEPIKILDGSFEGNVLYNNDSYVSTRNVFLSFLMS